LRSRASTSKVRRGGFSRTTLTMAGAVQAHQQLYGGGGGDGAGAQQLGLGAAMQALKSFQGGHGASATSGGQSAFVGLAMAEASKLFDQQKSAGNVAAGASKQSAVQTAAETALKMYMRSGSGVGGGGASSLMSMASKFL
jgi:hypothetical protein